MIPDEEVDRVLDAADIVGIIGEHVRLKRVGNSWRGPCPFHHGKHDNFSVMPNGGYRCFRCDERGSVFTFVQKHLGLDFVEAVKYVGAKSGIEVREVTRRTEGPDPREPLWEVVAATAEFFQRTLWSDDEGSAARAYIAQRGIDREEADRFGIGYSPRTIGALRRHLDSLGYPLERQIESGVMLVRAEGEEPRPRFRGRLMFPIHDARGRAVGFGGRSIDGSEPKYINSAESAIYSKGKLLYHMHEARHAIRKADRVLLVEGYFDALRTAAAGIDEVVAPLGTALTQDQAQQLRRYTPHIFLLYDSDSAGLKATFRAGDVLLKERATVQVVTLPEGEDPDTFVAKHGAAGLESAIQAAVDIFERKLQLLQRAGYFGDLAKSRKAIDRLLPTIRAAADPVTRDLYIARAAQASGVDRETLAREAAAQPTPHAPHGGEPRAARSERPVQVGVTRGGAGAVPGAKAEEALTCAMLVTRDRVEEVAEAISRIDEEANAADPSLRPAIRDPRLAAIQRAILSLDGDADPTRLAESLAPDAIRVLEELLARRESVVDVGATVDTALRELKARWRAERKRALTARLATHPEEADAIMQERTRLQQEIVALGVERFRS